MVVLGQNSPWMLHRLARTGNIDGLIFDRFNRGDSRSDNHFCHYLSPLRADSHHAIDTIAVLPFRGPPVQRAVLTGRVRETGDNLSIQVDLVDATTGPQLWGEEYEEPIAKITVPIVCMGSR